MKVLLTTIALNIESKEDKTKWIIDTYPRVIKDNEINDHELFIENFMKDYDGNGIINMNVLETQQIGYTTLTEIANGMLFADIRNHVTDFNHTILEY